MNAQKLREVIELELSLMQATVVELTALAARLKNEEPANIEKAGAGACLAQFYGGVERILVRVCKDCNVPIPTGGDWHQQLFRMFGDPPTEGLPALIDSRMEEALLPYRKFRHVFVHGYGVMLDWSRMVDGVKSAEAVFRAFAERVEQYLGSLPD